jgi:hypothetical protein
MPILSHVVSGGTAWPRYLNCLGHKSCKPQVVSHNSLMETTPCMPSGLLIENPHERSYQTSEYDALAAQITMYRQFSLDHLSSRGHATKVPDLKASVSSEEPFFQA